LLFEKIKKNLLKSISKDLLRENALSEVFGK
jgi:hypothetical protein